MPAPRAALFSATGSTRRGRRGGEVVTRRLGRPLLEWGAKNAIIVSPTADLNLATRAILFGAVGTAGQRCTTTRRIIVHDSIQKEVTRLLMEPYEQVCIRNPLDSTTLIGPLLHTKPVKHIQA